MSTDFAVELEVRDVGAGSAVIVLPVAFGIESRFDDADEFYPGCRVITVTHPGFGKLKRSEWCESVQDPAYIYMDFIERLALQSVTLAEWREVGFFDAGVGEKFFGSDGRSDAEMLSIARAQEGLAVYMPQRLRA